MTADAEPDTTTGATPPTTPVSTPPASQTEWHPASRFRARPMVRWLSPPQMLRGAYGEFFGGLFGAFADSRESQAALRPATVHCRNSRTADSLTISPLAWHGKEDDDDLWIDYVADIGDGFGPTYAVARQLSRPSLAVPDPDQLDEQIDLPRGSMLVMGGDEVYPVAGAHHYRERTIGPYKAAFDGVTTPTPLLAIPGNHDWYDGLGAFLENFTVLRPTTGGPAPAPKTPAPGARRWTTHQTRSYFAVELSDKWWLWGIDIALEAHIDSAQIQYFRDVAAAMPRHARIILCTAKPAWFDRPRGSALSKRIAAWVARFRRADAEPDSWNRLSYFMNETLGDSITQLTGPQVRMVISGDKHFYARHEAAHDGRAPTLVTSGGGGAYLSSTLDARPTLDVPLHWDLVDPTDATEYTREKVWPTPKKSVKIATSALWRIPLSNASLALIFGAVAAIFGVTARADRMRAGSVSTVALNELADGGVLTPIKAVVGSPTGLTMGAVLALALFGLAAAHKTKRSLALLLTLIHLVLQAGALSFTVWLAADIATGGNFWAPLIVPIAATAATFLAGLYRRLRDNAPDWRPAALAFGATAIVLGALWLFEPDDMSASMAAYVITLIGVGAVTGIMAFTVYLLVAQIFRVNLNELFVGLRHEGYKQFLRLRIADDGVEVFSIGYERVAQRHLRWVDGCPSVTQPPSRSKAGHVVVDHFVVTP